MSATLTTKLEMLEEVGYRADGCLRILDFGCGSGQIVHELRELGITAFGCDLQFKDVESPLTQKLQQEGAIRAIESNPYRLPFETSSFDVVISDQVFEHVQDYSSANAEIGRLLHPNGLAIHTFPSRLKPIESHVYVPFASVFRNHAWLVMWALLGVRNRHQSGKSARQVADSNWSYLRSSTNYLSKRQLIAEFSKHFNKVEFSEALYLKLSRRRKRSYSLGICPVVPLIYSTFWSRVVVVSGPIVGAKDESQGDQEAK